MWIIDHLRHNTRTLELADHNSLKYTADKIILRARALSRFVYKSAVVHFQNNTCVYDVQSMNNSKRF